MLLVAVMLPSIAPAANEERPNIILCNQWFKYRFSGLHV